MLGAPPSAVLLFSMRRVCKEMGLVFFCSCKANNNVKLMSEPSFPLHAQTEAMGEQCASLCKQAGVEMQGVSDWGGGHIGP